MAMRFLACLAAGFALLAVGNDVDAGLDLPSHNLRHRFAHTPSQLVVIVGVLLFLQF